jgi:hypothetical protein
MMKPRSFTRADAQAILNTLGSELGRATPTALTIREKHSNHVAEVHFDTGRVLIIKQARYAEMNARFHTSRLAARLLREQGSIQVPEYLDIPGSGEDRGTLPGSLPGSLAGTLPGSLAGNLAGSLAGNLAGTLAYWRIPLVTLDTLWPRLHAGQRRQTLRTWGHLIRRVQRVRLPGHGALVDAHERTQPLSAFLRADLQERLRPAAASVWPAATAAIDQLVAMIDPVQERTGNTGGVLIHNDLFTANMLCEGTPEQGVVCAGLIDFEDAFAGPPEAELAKTEVLHGPLFGQPWSQDCMRELIAGYGAPLDPFVTTYFRVFHLLNMGFHAAATGLGAHAAEVLGACRRELRALARASQQDMTPGGEQA